MLWQQCLLFLSRPFSGMHGWVKWTAQCSQKLRLSTVPLAPSWRWRKVTFQFSYSFPYGSVQFSCSVVSASLWPHGLQHSRLPCLSLSPRVCSNSCSLSWWCHPIICGSLLLLSSIFPSIRVFPNESVFCIRWPKYWSFSISPSNEYSGLNGKLLSSSCIPVVDSCWCMAKPIQYCKVINLQLK